MNAGSDRRVGGRLPVLAAACLLATVALGGCRRQGEAVRRPAPTAVRARLLFLTPAAEEAGIGGAETPATTTSGELPPSAEAVPALATAAVPQGVIPVPTSRPSQAIGAAGPPRRDPTIAALLDQVSPSRLQAAMQELATTERSAGGGAVAGSATSETLVRWLERAWRQLDGSYGNPVLVELEEVAGEGRGAARHNVLATLPGIGRSKRILYLTVGLPEDGPSGDQDPLATTRAMGQAAMLAEVARVLVQRRWDATIRLAAFSGGSDGEFGAERHAEAAAGMGLPIVAVLDLHLANGRAAAAAGLAPAEVRLQVAGPADGPSWQLGRSILAVGPTYDRTLPIAATLEATPAGGGLAFRAAGYAAVRLKAEVLSGAASGSAAGNRTALDAEALTAATRTVVGLVGHLALAPTVPPYPPVVELAADAPGRLHARWDPVADPAVAGYWLGWRRSEDATYGGLVWLGRGTRWLMEPQPPGTTIFVAVATSDDQGHASPFGPEGRWTFE